MVLENVTLFEVHLDDAQFSADAGGSDGRGADSDARRAGDGVAVADAAAGTESVDAGEVAPESSGRGRVLKLAAASVALGVVATVVARRVAGRGDESVEVDLETDAAFDDPEAADESERTDGPVTTSTPDGDERTAGE
jgi:hypothetical protein